MYSMREIFKGCIKSKRLYFDYFRYVRDNTFLSAIPVREIDDNISVLIF
jgi:hypothetical protein